MRFCAAAARASWVAKRTLVPNASRTEAYRCCSQHAGPDASEIDPGLEQLISLARFHEASQVFDYGCGTGRLIGRLLRQENPGCVQEVLRMSCLIRSGLLEVSPRLLLSWKRAFIRIKPVTGTRADTHA